MSDEPTKSHSHDHSQNADQSGVPHEGGRTSEGRAASIKDSDRKVSSAPQAPDEADSNAAVAASVNVLAGESTIEPMSGGEETEHIAPGSRADETGEEQEIEAEENEKRYSGFSASSGDRDLYLTDQKKEEFREKLFAEGIQAPADPNGSPIFTKAFVMTLPKKLAHEILVAAFEVDDTDGSGSAYSSTGSDTGVHKSQGSTDHKSYSFGAPDAVLGLRYSPSGIGYITDEIGQVVSFEDVVLYLENAFTDKDLSEQETRNKEKVNTILPLIKKERQEEETNSSLKKPESLLQLQEMALRYVPEVKMKPVKTDPINLFESGKSSTKKGGKVQRDTELVHLLDPRDFTRRIDSMATLASTVGQKLSNITIRGSIISTHLSDMPSTYSQALVEEPSMAILTPNDQQLDISPESASRFREKWLSDYLRGYTPKNTFTISIINLITRKSIEMRVCREYTVNEVCHLYMQYDDHPEYYVWQDVYGRVLNPKKTLAENGLMSMQERMEFQGYRKLPVILLFFRDGFENEQPMPLNPVHAMKQFEKTTCRNY